MAIVFCLIYYANNFGLRSFLNSILLIYAFKNISLMGNCLKIFCLDIGINDLEIEGKNG